MVLKNANPLTSVVEHAIHNDSSARHFNNNGRFHNESDVDMFENDNNEPDSGGTFTHSISLRQMDNDDNVQQHIRQQQKHHENPEANMTDDEYFIALNSDALRMDIDGKDESVRKIRSDEESNPTNASTAYNGDVVGDELCMDSNSSTCYRDDVDNITCVGDPAYCNYTYEEYVQMLHDYITPTVPEWILICSHGIVFFIGLVSNSASHTYRIIICDTRFLPFLLASRTASPPFFSHSFYCCPTRRKFLNKISQLDLNNRKTNILISGHDYMRRQT